MMKRDSNRDRSPRRQVAVTKPSNELARATDALWTGSPIVLIDDVSIDGGGDLVFAASLATARLVAFVVKHSSGLLTVAMACSDANRMHLSPQSGTFRSESTFAIAVDSAASNGTGISASDRAKTIALLGDANTRPEQLSRPGHVMTYRADERGVLGNLGIGEAALDLVRVVGFRGAAHAAIISEVDPVRMPSADELKQFAERELLPCLSLSSVLQYRMSTSCQSDPSDDVDSIREFTRDIQGS